MEELVEQLKEQIIDGLMLEEVTPDEIDPAAPLFGEGLGLDSIDALELVVILEKHHGLQISDMSIGKDVFASVNSIAKFVMDNKPT